MSYVASEGGHVNFSMHNSTSNQDVPTTQMNSSTVLNDNHIPSPLGNLPGTVISQEPFNPVNKRIPVNTALRGYVHTCFVNVDDNDCDKHVQIIT